MKDRTSFLMPLMALLGTLMCLVALWAYLQKYKALITFIP